MIAIMTKFLPATNTKGSRIKAYTDNGKFSYSATIAHPDTFETLEAHFEAVKHLIFTHGLKWDTSGMRWGDKSDGFVFCFDKSIIDF